MSGFCKLQNSPPGEYTKWLKVENDALCSPTNGFTPKFLNEVFVCVCVYAGLTHHTNSQSPWPVGAKLGPMKRISSQRVGLCDVSE